MDLFKILSAFRDNGDEPLDSHSQYIRNISKNQKINAGKNIFDFAPDLIDQTQSIELVNMIMELIDIYDDNYLDIERELTTALPFSLDSITERFAINYLLYEWRKVKMDIQYTMCSDIFFDTNIKDKEYGKIATDPILLPGVAFSNIFLNKLIDDNMIIDYKRSGSSLIKETEIVIDKYEVILPNQAMPLTWFVNPYHQLYCTFIPVV